MLATNRLPCLRAASMRLTWPACRLPMVGTNTTRSRAARHSATCARTSAMVVTVDIRDPFCNPAGRASSMEFVLGRGIGLFLHGFDIALERVDIRGGAVHEILHEARLAPRGDVEHVVEHEDLAVRIRPGADADDRHLESFGDLLAELRRDALEQHDVGARRFERLGAVEHALRSRFIATLHAKTSGLVYRLRLEAEVRAYRDVVAREE